MLAFAPMLELLVHIVALDDPISLGATAVAEFHEAGETSSDINKLRTQIRH